MTLNNTSAVVLGPGGLVGTAWMAGIAAGLRHEGVDLAAADLIVGTSAGAIVGTALATGQDLDRFVVPSRPAAAHDTADPTPAPAWDPGRLAEMSALLGDPNLEPAEARRRVGRLALAAPTVPEAQVIAQMEALLTARRWPARRLLITAVDVEAGEPKVWDRASGAPLLSAVASSCAAPGAYPPVTVLGRRYMDGALAGGSNLHLAADADADRLVVLEPMAHMFPSGGSGGSGDADAVRIVPDPVALAAFGSHPFDRTAWQPAYWQGVRQGHETAGRVRPVGLDGQDGASTVPKARR